MAASQDMLTRSRWQKADLGDLLRIELGQVFGKELPEGLLSGPEVLLDETTTQALGLTFHELATNALKYGEAGNSVGALKVDWSLEGHGRDRTLTLNWRESGQKKLETPTKTGFGVLGIYVTVAEQRRHLLKFFFNMARGKWRDNEHVEILQADRVVVKVHSPAKKYRAVIDGELVRLDRETTIRIHPGGLNVLVPARNAQAEAA